MSKDLGQAVTMRIASASRNFGRAFTSVALGALVWGAATDARAQAASTEGLENGVALGALVITPKLRLAMGFDSNVNLGSKEEVTGNAPELYVGPSVGFALREQPALRFNANAGVSWRQYFADSARTRDASGLDANVSANMQANHGGAVSFILSDQLRQSNDAIFMPDLNDDVYQISFSEYGVDLGSGRLMNNNAAIGMRIHPGGDVQDRIGFTGELRATHAFTHYHERPESNRHRIGGDLTLAWRFLPRSSVFGEVGVQRIMYDREYSEPVTRDVLFLLNGEPTQALANNPSTPIRFGIGMRTLLTERLGLMARLGYSIANYDKGPTISRPTAQVQLDSQLSSWQSLRFGWATSYSDSSFANYVNYHRLHFSYSVTPQRVRATASVFMQVNNYAEYDQQLVSPNGSVIEVYSSGDRRDIPVGLNLEVAARLGSHVDLGLDYSLLANFSDFQAEPARDWINGEKLSGDAEFMRHRVRLFLTLAL